MKYYESFSEQGRNYTIEGVLDHFNERIRVDSYTGSLQVIIDRTEQLAEQNNLSKLILKGKHEQLSSLISSGYTLEAIIPLYFQGQDAYFFTKYRKNDRKNSMFWLQEDEIVRNVKAQRDMKEKDVPSSFELRLANEKDAEALAQLFGHVFQVYPTPLNSPEYIQKTMQEDTIYYVYTLNGQIVSTASAEMNLLQGNAELTNCATLIEFRKHGLMKRLLTALEQELSMRHIYCAYTIARALSYGMNAAFYRIGYSYTGRLINNCYIFDKMEDMNVWAKDLSQ